MVSHWIEIMQTGGGVGINPTPLSEEEMRKLSQATRAKLLRELNRIAEILKWDWE